MKVDLYWSSIFSYFFSMAHTNITVTNKAQKVSLLLLLLIILNSPKTVKNFLRGVRL